MEVHVIPQKVKAIKKDLGRFDPTKMTPRKAAAILGQVRSFLAALPFLRSFTDQLILFTNYHQVVGWDTPRAIPLSLQQQVREIGEVLSTWTGRQFEGVKPVRTIHSDSSTNGWGAIDLSSGRTLQEFWRDKSGLHINIKELEAAIAAVKSFAKPGETVFLAIDNQVAYSYLKKGGEGCPPTIRS